jgi:DNA-binding transcriptional regulator YhcF (GntR family)
VILSVDPAQALPVYEQVREQIRRMVVAGTLTPGARLPTIRQLSADLGLAKGTIEHAYELLEADAVVERRGRKGTFVVEPGSTVPVSPVDLRQSAEQFVIVARQMGASEDDALAAFRAAWRSL